MSAARDDQGSDPLWNLEFDLNNARRVRGALRAVQCLVQPWRHAEAQEVEALLREDLAQMLEVIHVDLTAHLDRLDQHVQVLQGLGREAGDVVAKARRL